MKKIYFLLFTICLSANGVLAQGSESFDNLGLSGSNYASGSFTGDNAVTWNYVACRDENGDSNNAGINGSAIMLRRSSDNSAISALSGANGVGDITMNLYKGFTGGGARRVELFVNGISQGTSTDFDNNTLNVFTVEDINIVGDVLIEIKNDTGKQVIVDDVSWTAATLSTQNFEEKATFSMYPNPTSNGFVNIKTSNNAATQVAVYDILGKQVINTTLNGERLNVSKLNAGVYAVRLSQGNTVTTKKLVVK
ncbi:T9SS type A sorting domain-containing protein [uncultured Lacinutrix sp.]|uniref:T9SS type A sorting domain-containing protein n=1 Tax=uncultured Lacinutrix sp. TaxID=574032 RepID=UPI00262FA6AD|nr:T9SS type A sorting domain-containing protein [uncultured Lacinutrix sp.]